MADALENADAAFGQTEFVRHWIPAPLASESDEADGLGPLFNASSCAGCHAGPALSGALPTDGLPIGLVMRTGDRNGNDDPRYGAQIQTQAVPGVGAEGEISVSLAAAPDAVPEIGLDLASGPVAPGIATAPLLAPSLIGRAAIDRVDPAALKALAAQQAARGDGVAGIVPLVPSGQGAIGLFGYRSASPDLVHQISRAFSLDIGISSPLMPEDSGDCTPKQADCLAAAGGGDLWRGGSEISAAEISEIAAYLDELAAPAQAHPDMPVNADFTALGCAACHVPHLPARNGGSVVLYSDLLLHDMGPSFDNGIGVPGASAAHWRTSPLLALAPFPGRRYLHDGRAGSLDAAIRAHGGEAAASRNAYTSLPDQRRQALLAFLRGL